MASCGDGSRMTMKQQRTADSECLSRKYLKPVIEKKRRERINRHLNQLKALVSVEKSKLEKADILELAVLHLTRLTGGGGVQRAKAGIAEAWCGSEADVRLSTVGECPQAAAELPRTCKPMPADEAATAFAVSLAGVHACGVAVADGASGSSRSGLGGLARVRGTSSTAGTESAAAAAAYDGLNKRRLLLCAPGSSQRPLPRSFGGAACCVTAAYAGQTLWRPW